jgi:Tol biopolymer transport system component
VVFISDRDGSKQVYLFEEGEQIQITSDPGNKSGPRCSLDGQTIYYTNSLDDSVNIFAIDRAGGTPRAITDTPYRSVMISVLPEGEGLLIRQMIDEAWQYAELDLATGELTTIEEPKACNEDHCAYVVNDDKSSQLMLSDADRANEEMLLEGLAGGILGPVWSPDGRYLAYSLPLSDPNTQEWDLYLWDLEAGEALQISDTPGFDSTPLWAADGTWFMFESERTGNRDIYGYSVETGEILPMIEAPSKESGIAWCGQ